MCERGSGEASFEDHWSGGLPNAQRSTPQSRTCTAAGSRQKYIQGCQRLPDNETVRYEFFAKSVTDGRQDETVYARRYCRAIGEKYKQGEIVAYCHNTTWMYYSNKAECPDHRCSPQPEVDYISYVYRTPGNGAIVRQDSSGKYPEGTSPRHA